MKTIIWVFTLLVFLPNKSFAESNELDASVYIKNDGSIPYIVVDGNITKNTFLDIEKLIPRISSGYPKVINLNSLGGDVASAIKIGYLLRSHSFAALVNNRSKCASACVFILAGATVRSVSGDVGIHRPYEPNDKIESPKVQKIKYQVLEIKIKKFFSDVNISADLYDEMLRIAPSSIKWLSNDDLSRTGLGQDDPYYAEALAAQKSRELNISKQEYKRRVNMINTLCLKYEAEDKRTECIYRIDKYGHE